ncbi:MAG: restriction endonuclease subunit R, partial [Flavobacteriales bacterium]|nr:restriction endonuclease subunit R [Flavobacteriales bacterium]
LRPVNSMVEFKQIVGRGTRLFDGKDYFTVYDFVNAHHHFQDPEWDGEPEKKEDGGNRPGPRTCSKCNQKPCICEKPEPEACSECGNLPCVCDNPPKKMIKVKLSDNNFRQLDKMVKTSFWSPSGKPISAEEFMKKLFGDVPSLFKNEDDLRKIWSLPGTRKKLMEELNERGYSTEQLESLRKLIEGGANSDLYDLLAYIAYNKNPIERSSRSEKAKIHFNDYNAEQQVFLNFVLDQYVKTGVSELDDAKLPDLLELKYSSITDAKTHLGDIKTIRDTFIGFQGYLYETG